MSTRSNIIARCSDGLWRKIYCHWDGYLDHNGKVLFENYQDQKKIDKLLKLGSISSLGPEIGKKHDFDWSTKLYEQHSSKKITEEEYASAQKKGQEVCNVYHRDRGEPWEDTKPEAADTLAGVWTFEETLTEFSYVWDGRQWWVGDPDKGMQAIIDLGEALAGKVSIHPNVKAFGIGVIGKW